MSEIRTFREKPGKFWAMLPREEGAKFDSVFDAIDENRVGANAIGFPEGIRPIPPVERCISSMTLGDILKHCVVGLAHNVKLARARAEEAHEHPRITAERLFDRSFVEPNYPAGPLSVLAYTAYDDSHPEAWHVEGFVGDDVAPTHTYTLPMRYPTILGVDMRDAQTLNAHIDRWYPPTQ